jgi:hypothetical protein
MEHHSNLKPCYCILAFNANNTSYFGNSVAKRWFLISYMLLSHVVTVLILIACLYFI